MLRQETYCDITSGSFYLFHDSLHLESNCHVATFSFPEDFLHLFVRNSPCAVDFLETMTKSRPRESSDGLYNSLLEHLFHLYQVP